MTGALPPMTNFVSGTALATSVNLLNRLAFDMYRLQDATDSDMNNTTFSSLHASYFSEWEQERLPVYRVGQKKRGHFAI